MFTTIWIGIMASLLHVLTSVDHLAAITPIIIQKNTNAWKIGLSWSLGHMIGIMTIGIILIIFMDVINIELLSKYENIIIGVVLIFLGLYAFYKIYTDKKSKKNSVLLCNSCKKGRTNSLLLSFGIGCIYGLVGVTHIILMIPILSFQNLSDGFIYIVGFAIGTAIAIIGYTFVLGKLFILDSKTKNPILLGSLRFVGGLFAILIGIFWLLMPHH